VDSPQVAVIRALQAAVATVDETIDRDAKAERKASRAAAERRHTAAAVDDAIEKRDRLAEAAELLAPDWREWPWVREAGFVTKVPRKESQ
jgi:hypothetical protein